ncbi:PREDICTED: proline-rich protein 11-like [Drosophila arizonae]|uniref:Proline-rich protein 11-like n=1 Tax=Drosophila arizonae TaxID=7263 RepID=A0ABM1NLP2_DROAR|nr:PREDICTED: proline-rich protein 11-like [Drosophila arizonae]
MIFVPFSMPVPPQTVPNPFSHAAKESAKPFGQTPAPPPPLPPPPPPSLLLPLAFQCHYQTTLPRAGPLPARAPPTPPARQVLPLKVVAAAAIRAHQQLESFWNGFLALYGIFLDSSCPASRIHLSDCGCQKTTLLSVLCGDRKALRKTERKKAKAE